MAVVIDATVSGLSSNCYVTLARGNTLIEELPHADDWLSDIENNRPQLLVHATRLIDRHFVFLGDKTLDAQALEWPRKHVTHARSGDTLSDTVIPDFIEWATVEWAIALYLDQGQVRVVAPGLKSLRTPSYDAEFGGSGRRAVPRVVSDLLLSYGDPMSAGMPRLVRT